jgi:phosphoserine phosphatase RsbU/P
MRKPVILCVDDEKDILDSLFALILEEFKTDYDIEIAETANDALDIYSECQAEGIDIPITIADYLMPGIKGDELLITLHKKNPDMIKILLTGQATLEGVKNAYEHADLYRYIDKPWERHDLIITIKEALKRYYDSRELKNYQKNLESLVEKRTEEVREKSAKIMNSIAYASRIQKAILPADEIMEHLFPEHFILWQPLNIVGGDFYWTHQSRESYFIGIIDCTGHGVPGALMSMMAYTALNQVSAYICHDDPACILKEVNKLIKKLLNQDKNDTITNDGLDAGICCIKPGEKKVIFAGAGLRLYYTKEHSCFEIKGDSQSLGYSHSLNDFEFTNHEFYITDNEILYLTTDGFYEQPGGPKGFGFGRKRLQKLLSQCSDKKLTEQKELLKQELTSYRGDFPQRDDITVIGFKI